MRIINPFDYRFRNDYLWVTTLALREGCIVAEKIGAGPKLLQRLRKLADALDVAVEENYQGKKRETLQLKPDDEIHLKCEGNTIILSPA